MSNANWAPLESVLPIEECGDWMWMGTAHIDGHRIEQYKHSSTRGYLNLDADGQAWKVEYPADGCQAAPFCDLVHEHIPDSPPRAARLELADAIERALS